MRPVLRKRVQTASDVQQCQHTADALAQECRPGYAGYAHPEHAHEEDVHQNVRGGRDGQEDERRAGVAHRRKDTRRHVVVEEERQAEQIDAQVETAVVHQALRRVDEPQHRCEQQKSHAHQRGAEHAHGDERRGDGGAQIAIAARAEVARDDDRAADVAAKGESDEDQRDFIRVADGSQRVFADELACDEAVGDIVELLEEDAAQQRQAELPEHGLRLANREILVHEMTSFCNANPTARYYRPRAQSSGIYSTLSVMKPASCRFVSGGRAAETYYSAVVSPRKGKTCDPDEICLLYAKA